MEVSMVKSDSRSKNTMKTWDIGNGVGFCCTPLVSSNGVPSSTSSRDPVDDINVRLKGGFYVIAWVRNNENRWPWRVDVTRFCLVGVGMLRAVEGWSTYDARKR
jgi:hypothetical protein